MSSETRRLGNNGPEITTVGFGAWAAGGPWAVGWGPQNDDDSIAAIRRAIELGINWIDTAAIYGLGHSEEVVGRALQGISPDRVMVFTKCGRVMREGAERPSGDLRPATIRRECEDSLRRLNRDVIDLYQIHWPDKENETPLEDSWATMAALQDEGKVRHIGVSNFTVEHLETCEAIRHVDSLQPPYSLLRREIEDELLPWCPRHGVGVIVYSPMQAGLLSGSFDIKRVAEDDWRRNHPYFQEPALSQHLEFVERLRPIATRHHKTVGQLAVAWTLRDKVVTGAIVGARRPDQVEENVGAMGWHLTAGEVSEIEEAFRAVYGDHYGEAP
jgi:Predicted oxidoreductases (related to aryl-alcohol dehydrogenases)